MDTNASQAPATTPTDGKQKEHAKADMACKILFSDRVILARMMKACIYEYRDVPLEVIRDKLIEGEAYVCEKSVDRKYASTITGRDKEDSGGDEGTVYYDILFSALLPGIKERCGIIVNIEIQGNYNPGYALVTRGLFYCARILSSEKGRDFEGSNYKELKKVYSIWVCTNPPKDRRNTINVYGVYEKNQVGSYHEKKVNYDLFNVVMINLGPMDLDRENDILKYLSIVSNTKLNGKNKVQLMKEHFQEEWPERVERRAEEMYGLGDQIYNDGIAVGEARGEAKGKIEGKIEGEAQGMIKGKIEERINSIRTLMHTMPCDIHKAMDLLLIPLDARPQYQSAICGM